jgi:hypothetical protein
LKGIVLDKGPLHRMQLLALAKPLNRDDLCSLASDRQRETAIDTSPIEQNSTGPTLPMITSLLRSSESKMLAEYIEQSDTRVKL